MKKIKALKKEKPAFIACTKKTIFLDIIIGCNFTISFV